jgi:hypothetical protein
MAVIKQNKVYHNKVLQKRQHFINQMFAQVMNLKDSFETIANKNRIKVGITCINT